MADAFSLPWVLLPTFALILVFFHLSEFAIHWHFHRADRNEVSSRNFLCSRSYAAAMGLGFAEFALGAYFAPSLKSYLAPVCVGACGVVAGEFLRKAGEITAAHNFTHEIAYEHVPQHKLVTHGVYSWCRHPGYLGFFVWSISTQILLSNPVSAVVFAGVTWRFFEDRIAVEEELLVQFFGKQYEEYREHVPTRIPFIR
eukprot:g2971.t1